MIKKILESNNQQKKNLGGFEDKHLQDAKKGSQEPQTLKNPEKTNISQAVSENVIAAVASGIVVSSKRSS